MPKGETIKDLYSEIRKCLFYMIPENGKAYIFMRQLYKGIMVKKQEKCFFTIFPRV